MKLIRLLAAGSLLLPALGFAPKSLAREWYFQPSATVETLYDSNIRLLSNSQGRDKDAFGFVSYANGRGGVRADNYDIDISATGVIKRYISDLDLNNTNVYVNAKSLFKITERNSFGLNVGYAQDTVLGSVIDTTANAQTNTTRDTVSVNPRWLFAWTEQTALQLDYKHFDTTYDQTDPENSNRFADNTRDSTSAEVQHQWFDALKSKANFEAVIFDTPTRGQTTTNFNFTAGIDYRFSETWMASLGGGLRVTETDTTTNGLTVTDDSTGPLFLVKTRKTFETFMLEAGYYRETATRGSGGFSLVDVSYFGYTHKLSDHFQVGVRGTYNDVRSLIANNSQDFTFYTANPSASWLINPQMDLTASYRYKFRESQQNSDNNADSHTVFLTLNYKWDPFTTRKF